MATTIAYWGYIGDTGKGNGNYHSILKASKPIKPLRWPSRRGISSRSKSMKESPPLSWRPPNSISKVLEGYPLPRP